MSLLICILAAYVIKYSSGVDSFVFRTVHGLSNNINSENVNNTFHGLLGDYSNVTLIKSGANASQSTFKNATNTDAKSFIKNVIHDIHPGVANFSDKDQILAKARVMAKEPANSALEKFNYVKKDGGLKAIDAILVMDGSSSIGRSIFECGVEALQNAVEIMDSQNKISDEGTRVAALIFSSSPLTRMMFDLKKHKSLEEVKEGIRQFNYQGGGTRIDKALALVRQHFIVHGRSGAEKVVIIMTDGKSRPYTASRQALLLRNMGVEVFAVGIGVDINMNKINDMVSKPEDIHIIKTLNYCSFNSELIN